MMKDAMSMKLSVDLEDKIFGDYKSLLLCHWKLRLASVGG